MKRILKKMLKPALIKLGILKRPVVDRRPNPIHQWDDDTDFQNIMKLVEGYTLVDTVRCYMLYQLGKQAASLEGDIAEAGVYRGGTAMLLAKTFERTEKEICLFDTFAGMPPTDPKKDFCRPGDFNDTSLDSVKAYLNRFTRIRYYPGYFPDTAACLTYKLFSMVHIDVDIYKSVKDCIEFFYPRLVSGGIMVFDDYGFVSCPGAKEAVLEFFEGRPEQPIYLSTGQCLVIKINREMDMN